MSLVGNDVVDLREPRCAGKSSDERFLDRVFTDEEAADLLRAPEPDRRLWLYWAAKEAAFKVVSKLMGSPPTFEHDTYRARLADPDAPGGPTRGVVNHRDTDVPFLVEAGPDRVHCLAWYDTGEAGPGRILRNVRVFRGTGEEAIGDWEEALRPHFTSREWASIYAPASGMVRLRARQALARHLGLPEGDVEIVCDEGPPGRMPPRALVKGEPGRIDVSLSHHGRFLAWALALPRGDEGRDI